MEDGRGLSASVTGLVLLPCFAVGILISPAGTFFYVCAMLASPTSVAFSGTRADTAGLHELAVFMLVAAALFVVLTVVDRSVRPATR